MRRGAGGRRYLLDIAAYGLVGCALLFSAYCVLRVNWSIEGSANGGTVARKLVTTGSGGNVKVLEKQAGVTSPLQAGAVIGIEGQQAKEKPCPEIHAVAPRIMSAAVSVRNPRKYHLVTTAQGFSNAWQARIHYYWYKKQREICEEAGVCDMGGFTRLLHSGEADDLMDEIPTVVVDPLPKEIMLDNSYVVLNRPWAFLEWLKKVSIPEKYMIMGEGDHLWMRPMPNMMVGEGVGAALFSYMTPDKYGDIVRKFIGQVSDEEVKKVPQIGNSPTMMAVKDFRRMAPIWYNVTMEIFNDKEAHEAWSWVLEMYGFTIATHKAGLYGFTIATYKAGLHEGLTAYSNMLAHPPFDSKQVDYKGDPFYLLHLTYPMRFNKTGGMTDKADETAWMFDKRSYMDKPPPRNLAMPPANVDNELARLTISMFNEATDTIPCWDVYVRDKVITSKC
ncbi:hypothetical protein FOA52_002417 [Chlamydomonas sp. UWO 241]|nr:hypothetical protein FOA52_002417 [Chlamydomonas sp. UWO 241]